MFYTLNTVPLVFTAALELIAVQIPPLLHGDGDRIRSHWWIVRYMQVITEQ